MKLYHSFLYFILFWWYISGRESSSDAFVYVLAPPLLSIIFQRIFIFFLLPLNVQHLVRNSRVIG